MTIDWPRLRVRINTSGRVRCEPGWSLPPEWSARLQDFDLWFVWAGRGVMQLHDRTVELRPGMCIWARPGGTYLAEQDLDDPLGVSFIHFDLLDRRGLVPANLPLPVDALELIDVALVDNVLRRVVELRAEARRVATPAEAERARRTATSLFTGILMDYEAAAVRRLSPTPAGTDLRHHRMVHELAGRITEAPGRRHSVAALAHESGYSQDHLGRVFKSVMGISLRDFIVHARVNRARYLLAETALSVKEIADVLGYESVFFFSRQFRQKAGVAPTGYRRQRQGGDDAPVR